MKSFYVDINNPDKEAIKEAADAIKCGELVIFPTETVYGLAADAMNPYAVQKIFDAKGRDDSHSLPIQIFSVDMLNKVAVDINDESYALAKKYWPGPLTLILNKNVNIPYIVTGGMETIGVRIPDHPTALALLKELGTPIIATSANRTGEPPATCASCAFRKIAHHISVVLDSGTCSLGVSSTIVDVTVKPVKILRIGTISEEEILQTIGDL